MDHSALVRCLQRLGDLTSDWQGLVQRDRILRNPVGQRCPLDQFHHERTDAVVDFFKSVNDRDIRVVQGRKELGFPLKAGETIGIGSKRVREDFDSDVAAEPRIAGAIHLAHPARAEQGRYFVRTDASAWRSSPHQLT